MDLKTAWALVSTTISDFGEDRAMRRGASLAYYSVFSLAPLLTIAIAIAGLLFNRDLVTGYVFDTMSGFMGPVGAGAVREAVLNAEHARGGTIAATVSIVLFFFGAAGVFNQLKSALNAIWGVAPAPPRNSLEAFKRVFIDNFLSLTLVLGTGFLLAVSLLLDTALTAFSGFLSFHLPGGTMVWGLVNNGLTFAGLAVLFALMFKYLPDVRIAWREVWLGACLTALLFSLGKVAIGLYIGHSTLSSSYGAATSLVVLLIWVFYSA
ncbi:MAG TPA: YihY/virulence factor BrkB family protein, partial [Oscillatoriaceae cyanobacterium]